MLESATGDEVLLGLLSLIITVCAAGLASAIRHERRLGKLEARISNLETKIEPFWNFLRQRLPEMLKGPNLRKDALLAKYQDNSLSPIEAQELRTLLEKDFPRANIAKKIALGMLIEVLRGIEDEHSLAYS